MTLSFKRTGGKGDSKKKSKMGTGSITCKDVFRSAIVLGESKVLGDYRHIKIDKEVDDDVAESQENFVMHHYGGSDRTVDGGGQGAVVGASSRASVGGKRDSLSSVKSTITAKHSESGSESNSDSLDSSDGEGNDDSDADSDGEFMPTSKKRKNGKSDDTPTASEPKRTSRRSVSKNTNVSYADENSDVDLDDDDNDEDSNESENDKQASESEDDEFDELLDNLSKKPPGKSKPKTSIGGRASSGSAAASSSKISYVEIDSDEEDGDDDVLIMGSSSSAATTKTSNKPATSKTTKTTTKPATKNGASAKAPTKKTGMSSSPKSPISPRRRKKAAPRKSSSFNVMDLSDDSFSFL